MGTSCSFLSETTTTCGLFSGIIYLVWEMNPEEESFEYRQKHEISALQAIYLEDFVMINQRGNDSESSSKPTEFILHLKPHQGTANTNEVYAKLDLRVQLCESYPESATNSIRRRTWHITKRY